MPLQERVYTSVPNAVSRYRGVLVARVDIRNEALVIVVVVTVTVTVDVSS